MNLGTALVVARKDVQTTARSFLLWGVIGIFVLLLVSIVALPGILGDVPFQPAMVIGLAGAPVMAIVPITALMAGYLAVAGERESGSIRLLLSMPPTRAELVLGKFLGRSAVVLLAIVLAFALAAVASLLVYGEVPLGSWLEATVLTGALGVAFVAIAVGISAATSTRARAMGPTIAFYVVGVALWTPMVTMAIYFVVTGGSLPTSSPDWLRFLETLPPAHAFDGLFQAYVGGSAPGASPDDPWYLGTAAKGALLALWIVVPPVLGYVAFSRADLG